MGTVISVSFLLYDFEVFKNDWLVVFKPLGGEHTVIINDYDEIKSFFKQHEQDIFVGYNNKHYDDHVLKGLLSDLNPKKINDWIIYEKKHGWNFPGIQKIYFKSLDLKLDITGAVGLSLKQIESNLGISIEESSVDFDIDRKLTHEEILDVVKYCKHDVDSTEKLFEVRFDYIKAKLRVINKFNMPLKNINKTNAQLTAEVLGPRKLDFDDALMYDFPDTLRLQDKSILQQYQSPIDYNDKRDIMIRGVKHKLAYGGLHGALEKSHFKGNIYHYDVNSYYPSMIIRYDYLSRRVKNPIKYKEILQDRLKLKMQGKKEEQIPLKLILNTTYGAMKYEYNPLFDPKQCNQICITGQLLLLDLLEKLPKDVNLIQSNTDGIFIQTDNIEACDIVVKEWEDRTGLKMGKDEVNEIWQKDVNNYIIEFATGEIECKGSYVKGYFKPDDLKHYPGGSFVSNSKTIVDKAVVDYFVYDVPVADTINTCMDPIRFQITAKMGSTFKRVEQQINDDFITVQKVNRLFACTDSKYGKLYKIKPNGKKTVISSLPDHCLVFNKEVDKLDMTLIDKDWYINEANSRISDFIGG